jgi:hypothetical protein
LQEGGRRERKEKREEGIEKSDDRKEKSVEPRA